MKGARFYFFFKHLFWPTFILPFWVLFKFWSGIKIFHTFLQTLKVLLTFRSSTNNFIRSQLSEFYPLQENFFFALETKKFPLLKQHIPRKPLHTSAIGLQIWQFQTIFKILTQSLIFYYIYPRVLFNAKILFFQPFILLFQAFELSLFGFPDKILLTKSPRPKSPRKNRK